MKAVRAGSRTTAARRQTARRRNTRSSLPRRAHSVRERTEKC